MHGSIGLELQMLQQLVILSQLVNFSLMVMIDLLFVMPIISAKYRTTNIILVFLAPLENSMIVQEHLILVIVNNLFTLIALPYLPRSTNPVALATSPVLIMLFFN